MLVILHMGSRSFVQFHKPESGKPVEDEEDEEYFLAGAAQASGMTLAGAEIGEYMESTMEMRSPSR